MLWGTRVREAGREATWSVPLSQGSGSKVAHGFAYEGWGANAGFWGMGSLASMV